MILDYLIEEEFFNMCLKEGTCKKVAQILGVSESTIHRNLKRLDISRIEKITKLWNENYIKSTYRYTINENTFDVFSDEMSYWLGMLASDGCVYANRNKISINAKFEDKEHIEAFSQFLEYSGKVKERISMCNGKKFHSVYLEIHNKYLKERLIELGVVPKKSNLDINYLNYIPKEYKLAFIAGYLDGDGSIIIVNREYNKIDIRILGNKTLLYSIKKYLEDEYKIKSYVYKEKGEKYNLCLRRKSIFLFCEKYLQLNERYLLKRKRERIIDFLNVYKNNNVKIIRKKKTRSCILCGTVISKSAKNYCITCFNKKNRKVERPLKEILKEEIRGTSFTALGKKYGVSDNTVRKWCNFYKLPYKSKEIKMFSNEEWVKI